MLTLLGQVASQTVLEISCCSDSSVYSPCQQCLSQLLGPHARTVLLRHAFSPEGLACRHR